mmetsp:Transcript_30763/g.56933  ORF Transcript_30763/g.56933 Transcript_30763/m.56933 type:complete len:87 (+) Transcript_30763:793-1053(+)
MIKCRRALCAVWTSLLARYTNVILQGEKCFVQSIAWNVAMVTLQAGNDEKGSQSQKCCSKHFATWFEAFEIRVCADMTDDRDRWVF